MDKNISVNNCPCGRTKTYENCCGIIHKDQSKAITAEDLMRSRFTAFTQGNGGYLMQSHHSKTRNPKDKKGIEQWAKSVNWLKLDILTTSKGLHNDSEGVVEFKAFFLENGSLDVIHEISTFKRENGSWMYYGAITN